MALYRIVGGKMVENLIRFYKNIPRIYRHSIYRLKMHRKWTLLTFAIGILLTFIITMIFRRIGTVDVKLATIDYRLTGLMTFAVIWIAIFINYRFFPRDYYVTRHYNSTPFLHVLLSSALYSLVLLILTLVMAWLKPVNTDTTVIGVLFYIVMSLFFITVISFLLGMIYILYPKLDKVFYIVSLIVFCLSPILYIPDGGWQTRLLMLNPIFYLVNGMQQSVIIGKDAINNLGYHIYFFCFMGLMIVFSFALKDYVTQLRPNEHQQLKS